MTQSSQIKFAMTCVLCCCYISYFDFPEFPSLSFINIFRLAFSILNFSAKTFHIFLTFQVTSKCRRSQRMARQLLRIQTESCPMCAKITRRAALKNKNKTNLSTIRRRKIFSLFLFDSLKEDKSTSSPSLLPPPRSSQFLIFSSFFRTDLKKRKSRFENRKYEVIFYVCCFFEHIQTQKLSSLEIKVKIHHDNKKYSQ